MLELNDIAEKCCRRRVRPFVRNADGKLQIDRHFRDFVLFRESSCVRLGSGASSRKGSVGLIAILEERLVGACPAHAAHSERGEFPLYSKPHPISRGRSCR